jgi:hypothetical protein
MKTFTYAVNRALSDAILGNAAGPADNPVASTQ